MSAPAGDRRLPPQPHRAPEPRQLAAVRWNRIACGLPDAAAPAPTAESAPVWVVLRRLALVSAAQAHATGAAALGDGETAAPRAGTAPADVADSLAVAAASAAVLAALDPEHAPEYHAAWRAERAAAADAGLRASAFADADRRARLAAHAVLGRAEVTRGVGEPPTGGSAEPDAATGLARWNAVAAALIEADGLPEQRAAWILKALNVALRDAVTGPNGEDLAIGASRVLGLHFPAARDRLAVLACGGGVLVSAADADGDGRPGEREVGQGEGQDGARRAVDRPGARAAGARRAGVRGLAPALAFALALPALPTLGGCGSAEAARRGAPAVAVTPAKPRPDVQLTATDGTPYDFAERTRGRLTLLLFGYASCPDVCPVHLANIAAALEKLPPRDRARVAVVFVTTDPERDTPQRIRAWLDSFDATFVGLRGDTATVARFQTALGLAPAVRQPADAGGRYEVGHAAQVLVFTPDDSLRAMYPFGVRQHEWAADLPRLLAVPAQPAEAR